MNTYKAEQQAAEWLKQNGINAKHFAAIDVHLLKAQMIASNLLKHHTKLLQHNEVHSLQNFLKAMSSKAKRAKLTKGAAYKVMNIGTAVNRKLFKAVKAIERR